jgi:hypothetical protein
MYGKNRHNSNGGEYSYSVKAANFEAEKNLLILMLNEPRLRGSISGRINSSDFTDALHSKLFEMLKADGGDERIKEADIINAFTDRQEVNRIVAMIQEGLPADGEGIDKLIGDCIHTISIHKYRLRSNFLKGEIERLAGRGEGRTEGEEELYRGYCAEFVKIQRKLRGL